MKKYYCFVCLVLSLSFGPMAFSQTNKSRRSNGNQVQIENLEDVKVGEVIEIKWPTLREAIFHYGYQDYIKDGISENCLKRYDALENIAKRDGGPDYPTDHQIQYILGIGNDDQPSVFPSY